MALLMFEFDYELCYTTPDLFKSISTNCSYANEGH